jgi:hypothetical protein
MNFKLLAAATLSVCILPLAHAEEWSPVSLGLAATSVALHLVDWGQTQTIAKRPDLWKEKNAFLGEHPTLAEVNRYFIGYGLLVAAAAHFFPEYRNAILGIHIGMHGSASLNNFRLGIKVNW